ncbi:MAG TPA: c-type cytochrome [Gemmatimonadales bacterium]|jgi:tetratricopeptide (TPR) repeat protein
MRRPLAAALVVAYAAPASAQFPPEQLKNIKAFPASIQVPVLIDSMKAFTRALGVRCTYCHVGREDQSLDQYDFAADDNVTKEKARTMIRMVNAINTQFLAALPARRDPPITVSCITCHRGVAQPRPIQQVVMTAYQTSGADSAESLYRALRARYLGSAAYDFGEVPLTDVGAALQAAGKGDDAIRFYKLNIELLPTSGFGYRQLGLSYLEARDTASALAAFQKRLALQPANGEAKQMVDALTKHPLKRQR